MYGYVYKTTNNINGWFYIGQHKSHCFDKKYKGSGVILKQAFDEYGWDNFTTKILATAWSAEELNKKEKDYIYYHKKLPNCYNVAKGGAGASKWIYVDLKTKRIFYTFDALADYAKPYVSKASLKKYLNRFGQVDYRLKNGKLHWSSKRFAMIPSEWEGKIGTNK
jgi:hypothetical protein